MKFGLISVALFVPAALLVPAALFVPTALLADEPVVFQARSARSGAWSAADTWEGERVPRSGDFVQVRAGHTVVYDLAAGPALRMIHVAGTLTFSREKSTRLEVGLLKVAPGETTTEDGFDCHEAPLVATSAGPRPVLEIGTPDRPIPRGVRATIRLRFFPGTNRDSLPALVVCGGRWEAHGMPLRRTWLPLAQPAPAGAHTVTLAESVADWQVGDRILILSSASQGPEAGATFRPRANRQKPVGTEERTLVAVDGATLTLDRPLRNPHLRVGAFLPEVANLSRNVIVESAEPQGVRGHTMYHQGSAGGLSYAEFRHLGKENALGRYPIHFHLVRDTMRGSSVQGVSVWDSHNRWITIHGTDHLLIRDCVGYQSLGHGFFLEDGTEQWNVLDRNLAVQAFGSIPLPLQVLPFDQNDGAGFWWANGRNTFTRNVACENDRYGFHFQITQTPDFDPRLPLTEPNGQVAKRDVRTVPFLRFEDNASHSSGLFEFRFGDESRGQVASDRAHPFIARNLRAWAAHYALRPNVRSFLLEGFQVAQASYGIYYPSYYDHVYRDVELRDVSLEPLNGGHDEWSLPPGDFTFERLKFWSCRLGREPLVQLTAIGTRPGLTGHFRNVSIVDCDATGGRVVDFRGGPRTNKVEPTVRYYFHRLPEPGRVTQVVSARGPEAAQDEKFEPRAGWTGPLALAAEVPAVPFPALLGPIDDLPPATLITSVAVVGPQRRLHGVAHDNGDVAQVLVNGQTATITSQHAGVADWTITLDAPPDGCFRAHARDRAGNVEARPHVWSAAPFAP